MNQFLLFDWPSERVRLPSDYPLLFGQHVRNLGVLFSSVTLKKKNKFFSVFMDLVCFSAINTQKNLNWPISSHLDLTLVQYPIFL